MRIKRYLRLYGYFLRFSLSRNLQFRFDFLFKILMDCMFYVVNIAVYKVFFTLTPEFGGWNEHQAMIFVGGFLTVDAIYMCFFSANLWMLPQEVNKGNIDQYLLRPVGSLFFLSLREFSWDSFVNFIIAFGFLSWQLYTYPDLNLLRAAFFIFAIFLGTYIDYLMQLLFIFPCFWTGSPRGFSTLHWTMQEFYERPDAIFRGPIRIIVTTILPYSIFASFPARIFFEANPWPWFGHMAIVAIVFQWIVLKVWNRALMAYSSASS